jgi:hypothetical protein
MTKHRRITGFVAIALLAAVTTATTMKSRNQIEPSPVFKATQVEQPGAGTIRLGQDLGAKKSVRYEAIIDNWKRHRASKPNG